MNKIDMTITPLKLFERNELQLTLVKTFEFTSYVMAFHVFKDSWTHAKGEMLKAVFEPKIKRTNRCCDHEE